MKLKYLGTAAAEGVPALFCDCETCRRSKALGGKNIRSRSQAIINDDLLIDLPCDHFMHLIQNQIDFLNIKYCLITHPHLDHLYAENLTFFKKGFSHPPEDYNLSFFGSNEVYENVHDFVEKSQGKVQFNIVRPFAPFKVGNYTVTALKALHGTREPYFYMIDDGFKKLLYCHDTDYFPDETWNYLIKTKPIFDLVSLDCTEGQLEKLPYKGHMCLGVNMICRENMLKLGLADENTKFVLNHFSHNGKDVVYDDFKTEVEKHGFITSFDGLEIEI